MVRASILPLSLLDLSFADEDDLDFAIKAPLGPLTTKQVTLRADQMRHRINACCKGLLEAKSDQSTRLADTKVGYLHRTVKDFLEQDDVSAKLRDASRDDFNVNQRLYNVQVMRLKRQDPERLDDAVLWRPITYAVEYAVRAEPEYNERQRALLEGIDKVAQDLCTVRLQDGTNFLERDFRESNNIASHWTWTRIDFRDSKSFLGFAVQCQLTGYVDAALQRISAEEAAKAVQHLYRLACESYSVCPNERDRPSVRHHQPNEQLLSLLLAYQQVAQEEEEDEKASMKESRPRRRWLCCFCFG
ncbi:hypothetical protein ACN47E_008809 [Coniothyrium glycines]